MAVNNCCNEVPTISGTANQIAVTQAVGTSTATIALATSVVNSTQPAFVAYQSATVSNVTGDGTQYTILFDTVVRDQASNYSAGTGTFTAPVTGMYLFTSTVFVQFQAVVTTLQLFFAASPNNYTIEFTNAGTIYANSNTSLAGSAIIYLTATQTCHVTLISSGGTKTASVLATSPIQTFFCGKLLV
jgi:hypothetical protein